MYICIYVIYIIYKKDSQLFNHTHSLNCVIDDVLFHNYLSSIILRNSKWCKYSYVNL